MSQYNFVKLGSIWLTDDGSQTGLPCRTDIPGLDLLALLWTGQTILAADGSPHVQVYPTDGRGSTLTLKPLVLTATILNQIKTLISNAIAGDNTIQLVIQGDTGNFDVNVKPVMPKPIGFGTFTNGRIHGVEIVLVVKTRNP